MRRLHHTISLQILKERNFKFSRVLKNTELYFHKYLFPSCGNFEIFYVLF